MLIVKIYWDNEAKVWIAINMEIGLTIESESYDELVERVQIAAPEMALENKIDYTKIVIEKVEDSLDYEPQTLECIIDNSIDNNETLNVIEEARNGIGLSKAFTDIDDLMADLKAED